MRLQVVCGFLCAFAGASGALAAPIDFARQVQPVLNAQCGSCHGGDKRSGGFTVREYAEMLRGGRSGASVMPGDPQASLLLQRIKGQREPQMPLGAPPLAPAQVTAIETWISEGARLSPDSAPAKTPWIPKLALQPPPVPDSHGAPLDAFLAAYFQKRGLPLLPPVSDPVFARRAYLDVIGLLPPPEELAAFVQDAAPDKRARLVDRLLADNRNYAENWISYWNDLLRNDGGDTYHGGRKSITDWLYRALESNLPYQRFVAELLNPAPKAGPEGFLIGVNWRGDINASQTPVMQAAQNSAQVFLGVNLKCNSCHDSFISRWKLKDAYGLAAFFADTPKLELVRCDSPTGQYATPTFLYPELSPAEVPQSLQARHAAAARMFTDPRNGRTPRTLVNRYWSRLLGRGLVPDVDDLDGEPWSPELLDWLAADFVAHAYDLKHLVRTILLSRAYQLPAVSPEASDSSEYVFRGPYVRRVTAEQLIDAIGALTGEWEQAPEATRNGARYSRDWRVQSSSLTRALGRPMRDQVFTERDQNATTLQALELVNGTALTRMLDRGAKRLTGQLKPSPANLFDSGKVSNGHVPVYLDISDVDQLHLVVADAGSYSPERVVPLWTEAQVKENGVWKPLPDLGPLSLGSEKVIDARGKHWTRFRALAEVDKRSLQSDIGPAARFFVFRETPDWERLVRVSGDPPLPAPPVVPVSSQLIDRLWLQALGRSPSASERSLALASLQEEGGLADVLWSILMLPEFQLIH